MIQCMVCKKSLGAVTLWHLAKHSMTIMGYKRLYPGAPFYSRETREKISAKLRGSHHSEASKANRSNAQKGHKVSEETRAKIRAKLMGNKHSLGKGKFSTMPSETRRKISTAFKKLWQDPAYVRMIFKAQHKKPTMGENLVGGLLQGMYPNEFEYNGGGELGVTLNNRIPDFINTNGRKQVIEFNGCYWHRCPLCRPELRGESLTESNHKYLEEIEKQETAPYERLGYKCLILWEHDNQEVMTGKIRRFMEE